MNFFKKLLGLESEAPPTEQSEEALLDAELAKVRFFHGSQGEYQDFVGYPVSVIDVGEMAIMIGYTFSKEYKDQGFRCRAEIKHKRLYVERGIEAVVNCDYIVIPGTLVVHGLPIAKKK